MPKKRAFLIDDDSMLREVMTNFLNAQGFDVIEFPNATGVAIAVGKQKPDVIVTDFNMPGLNGAELCKEIRAIDSEVPIIMMTGNPDDAKDTLAAIGVTDVIVEFKPQFSHLADHLNQIE